MSRKSRMTVEVLIRMPLPAGVKADKALTFIRHAVQDYTGGLSPTDPMTELARQQIVVKLVKRETIYL